MIEAFRFTVSDRPVCEQRGETAPARILKRELPFHVQEGFLLSRETCIGKVLGGGAATHGNGRVINSRATAELPISSQYIFRDEGRHLRLQEQATNGLSGFLQRAFPRMESGKMLGDQRRKLVVMNKCAISFSGCGETRWHLDALLRKSRRHLAQRRIFAANGRHVGDGDFLEPQDQWLGPGFPPAWAWRPASCRLSSTEERWGGKEWG